MQTSLKRFLADDDGATAIEYAMIASLISVVIIGLLMTINQNMIRIFDYIGDHISAVLPGGE